MAKKQKEFEKLPGVKTDPLAVIESTTYSLWCGKDRLLSLSDNKFSEDYKWFSYDKIQAVTVCKTRLGWTLNLLYCMIAVFWFALVGFGFLFHWSLVAKSLLGFFGGICLILLFANWFKGPTCKTYIQTSVQRDELRSLNRMKSALKAVNILRQHVEAVQGVVSEEMLLKTGSVENMMAGMAGVKPAAPDAKWINRRTLKPYHSQAHLLLFTLLLADVCHSCVRFYTGNVLMYFLSLVLMFSMLGATIYALIKQHGTNITDGIKTVTWITSAYMCAMVYVAHIHSTIAGVIEQGKAGSSTWETISQSASTMPADSMYLKIMLIITVVCSSVLGFTGIFLLRRFDLTRGTPPPVVVSGGEEENGIWK